uniref:Uncharacterized protein n=1 Tax=Rhizochromulina marina TaxID=1034831 RepID=A0A7S2WCQ0_9STRA
MDKSRDEVAQLETEVTRLGKLVEAKTAQLDHITDRFISAEHDKKMLMEQNKLLIEEKQNLVSAKEAVEREQANLQQANAQLQEEASSLRDEVGQAHMQLAAAREAAEKFMRKKVSEFQAKVAELTRALEQSYQQSTKAASVESQTHTDLTVPCQVPRDASSASVAPPQAAEHSSDRPNPAPPSPSSGSGPAADMSLILAAAAASGIPRRTKLDAILEEEGEEEEGEAAAVVEDEESAAA